MVRTADPYYNRKPVPDELIKDVGITGLSPEEEYWNREKKYTANGPDVRRFSNSRKDGMEPLDDPYYGRKPVSKAEIASVGITGLTPEQEYWSRERKYSLTGVDVRKFSKSRKGAMEPQDDPYSGRKQVSAAEIAGIGETGMTPAEQFEVRERKQSLFQLSSDPFDVVVGRHRQSVSGVATGASAAATRRRSSAVAPDTAAAATIHRGYHGDKLAAIESRPEIPPASVVDTAFGESGAGSGNTSETLNTDGEHTTHHDPVTTGHDRIHKHHNDQDDVAPHEIR
ncbi:uncharacterized protein Z518_05019 [Rhinocladiella mackenziei CBS 650.93]|uniref:Uncharacterized protein n=1 Tax=Rhinocladiella mackenziei CBS 650.93 TaxID=1442369 RepID=A0A0D2FXM9_9EURO|nr:uncharacterized protein Z518_05019 [Rhinocladiella mackenziei CBS 650.93]KIX07042.1 hypothetical protein Z518_05019 [Rhinocladiella mackenziei CBS 650.93]